MQWIPMCDTRFTERNAEVICRQLGFSDLNVYLDFDQRIEYHENSLTRIIYWPEPFQCNGKESRLSHCPIRMNGQIYGHKYGCNWKGKDYAFISCGDRNLPADMEYWGGVRFAVKSFEQELFHDRIHDAVGYDKEKELESTLQYVQIIGAGILHDEKSPAIQSVLKSPLVSNVNISQCAYDAVNLVSPPKTVNLLYNKIDNNLGKGVSAAILTGEISEAETSAFVPVKEVPIPYNTFGLVDICDTNKEIVVEERILVYYKYDNNPVDCVKIFSSVHYVKPIGFRILQYNFVNSSGEPWAPDHLTLYDGRIYNRTVEPMVTIKVDDDHLENKMWSSSKNNVLSVKFHATGARNTLGFVAEVVTLPISFVSIDRHVRHNISFSVISNNQRGAVEYISAGEINPIVTMARNQFINNCVDLYGNFSSCNSAIYMDIQNTQNVFFHNNYVAGNIGGLHIWSGSSGTATSLVALLHNNVFSENVKEETLNFQGRQASPYENITMYRNYMTRNDVKFKPVIVMNQVTCTTSYNTFFNNYGRVIMEVTGFEQVRNPIFQTFTHNGFHNNIAYGKHCQRTTLNRCEWGTRATIVAGSAGQQYADNIFYNLNNDYEMVALKGSPYNSLRTPISAKYNYWAYNDSYTVPARIKDVQDEDGLLQILYSPWYYNNKTLLSGKCHPGWTLVGETCFMYHGAPMSFDDAKDFCLKDNATMPYLMDRYYEIHRYLETQQADWRYYDMVWVKHLDSPADECTVFRDGAVETVSCDLLFPALCELDPHVNPRFNLYHLEDYVTIGSICAALACFILITLVAILWCTKNRTRKKERFERRNSIRLSKSSLGSRSLASMQSQGFSDINYRRRMINSSRQPSIVGTNPYGDYKSASMNFESMDKRSLVMNSTIEDNRSFDVYETKATQIAPFGSHLSPGSTNFIDLHGQDVHYAPSVNMPGAQTLTRPVSNYDGFENQAYRPDTSTMQAHQLHQEDSQRSLWQAASQQTLAMRGADSVLELKRDMNSSKPGGLEQAEDSANTSESTQSTEQEYQTMDQDYQTMDRTFTSPNSTFRPSVASNQNNGIYGQATLQVHQEEHSIPSVPGYAKPFAHSQQQQQTSTNTLSRNEMQQPQRPYDPPPAPPGNPPRANNNSQARPASMVAASRPTQTQRASRVLETSLDDDIGAAPQSSRHVRSKSMQFLETNLDEDNDESSGLVNTKTTTKLSRSMQLINGSLTVNSSLLETDM